MAVVGVGVDVVDVDRFAATLSRTPGIAMRLFTPAERGLARPERLAARFAAKEAVAKVLGAPPGLEWHDAEVVLGAGGRPSLRIRGTVAAAAARLDIASWHLSLTHDGGVAVAMVVAES
ncbi:phosphopantetheine--protein transferase [Frankia torreyi]|uniref:Holo-[acyl-carrier-protein] synthase n=1 Tax=Frankia torreyi TaxID=1856 RepID=A0A0D8BIY3_9ACTN|nr:MULTISPECIES: holo-ACP synthase [Frankia]KJE24106.1 phosphopantetheine--protein transferase [Frankia torreyi]KQC39371.1 ACP synthase [Frankia sp. ACN1ag]KQM06023.1 phosphopantetheine--protein transferase [Frankia sp. CpI1-P]